MSNTWINQVKKMHHIHGSVRSVLFQFADMADEDGRCWPSLNTLARCSGISRRQVIRAIKLLKQGQGIRVEVERRRGSSHANLSNMYCLVLEEDDTSPPGSVTPCHRASVGHQAGDTMSPELVTPCHQAGDTMSPKPSLETKSEPSIQPMWDGFLQTFRTKPIYDRAASVQVAQEGGILRIRCPSDNLELLEARLGPYIRRYFAPYVQQVEFCELPPTG